MKRFLWNIKEIFKIIFWSTPWGRAYILISWKIYKESALFKLRAEHFGMEEAAKMLTLPEFRHFLWRAEKEYGWDLGVTFAPYTVIEKLEQEDAFLKHLVKFTIGEK